MSRANLYALTAKGAFLNIKFRYGSLLVPHYRLVFTALKALPTVYAAGITLLSTGDIS